MRRAILAMALAGTLLGAGSALAEDARATEEPVVLAAGDALGLAIWGQDAQDAAREKLAQADPPAPAAPAAIPEE